MSSLRSRATSSCVIACTPRSGSWLLSEALHNTGLLGQPEEYFRPDHIHLWARRWGLRRGGSYDRFVAAAVAFGTTDNGIFSVKLHRYQFVWLLERLRELPWISADSAEAEVLASAIPRPRYVFLTRRSKARQAVSYFLAARSQAWFQLGDGAEPEPAAGTPREDLGPDGDGPGSELADLQTVRWLEQALVDQEAAWRDSFLRSDLELLEVGYEDFADHYEDTVFDVLDFMDVVPPPGFRVHEPQLRRQANERTEALLARYLTVWSDIEPIPAAAVWSKADRRYVVPGMPGTTQGS